MSEPKVSMYMRWFVGDYLADTDHLSLEEHGAYSLLLFKMWQRGGALPLDHDQLARLCRSARRDWDRIWPEIRAFFVVTANGDGTESITQKRLVEELHLAHDRCARAASNGKKGGEAKRAIGLATARATAKPQLEPPLSSSQPTAKATGVAGLEQEASWSGVRGQEETLSARDPSEPDDTPATCTGDDLTRWYAQIRAEFVPGALPWVTPKSTDGAASSFADKLSPREVREVKPTMRIHFSDLLDGKGKAGAKENATYGFGCWRGDFSSLRERLHGAPRNPVSSPADFRRGPSPLVVATVAAMGDRAAAKYGD